MNYSWYTNTSKDDSADAIHQILAFGSLYEIRALKRSVGGKTLKDLFLRYPKKIYTAQSLHFIKKFLLHIYSFVDDQKYLISTPRYTR